MSDRGILAAVDLTDEAEEVLAAAVNLAERMEQPLQVVTVVRPIMVGYADLAMVPTGSYAGDFEREAIDYATTTLKELASKHNISPEQCSVLVGPPAAEIRKAAEDSGTKTIVIGNHGRKGLGLILGSTANSVLHGVSCDVLVVRISPAE